MFRFYTLNFYKKDTAFTEEWVKKGKEDRVQKMQKKVRK